MKNQILRLSLFALVITLGACRKEKSIKGSGNIIAETRVLDSFDGVESSGSATINITYGTEQKVEVLVDDNAMHHIQTSVHNSILRIEKDDYFNFKNLSLTLNITIPRLNSIKNSGSGEFDVSGFNGISSLSVKNSGSGEINLNGSGIDLTLKNSGSGKIYGFNFVSKNCYITNSGSGLFEIYCSDKLEGKNSGSGKIYYKGYPTIDFTNSGSGSIVNAN